ncbi:MAG: site-specific DNA-methyltransferase [Enterococcus sp.]|nr:site-specific DNA-methyltransferase [Enterococcus sp.]
MAEQQQLFEFKPKPVIKGYPELRWTGKHPYTSTQYFPAQLKESYGEPVDGWMNKIFWGDNIQVMSHLLKDFRGKIDLIYIDPPFDSKADYKKKIKLRGKTASSDSSSFEEKQYGDIWTSDEYLQFMYERLILCKELLSDTGSIYVHCDWHKSHFFRLLLDEIFGYDNFVNEIIWNYTSGGAGEKSFSRKHDTIYLYSKTKDYYFNKQTYKRYIDKSKGYDPRIKYFKDSDGREYRLNIMTDVWSDIGIISPNGFERTDYPTQKPEDLIKRILETSTIEGNLVFDCFMGSGTTQAVAMKMNRRFLGADINLAAVQTTTKRLITIQQDSRTKLEQEPPGFEVYNVNNYDFFRNPVEAKELIIQAFEIQKIEEGNVYDGELDGRMVKIFPTDRIATKADIDSFIPHLPYRKFEEQKTKSPSQPVEKIIFICMGHEPSLKAAFENELNEYNVDVEIVDILREKENLQFKHDAEAEIVIENDKLIIKDFYPLNLMQKLSLEKETVENWRELVDSVLIDFNYDGETFKPDLEDIPEKNELVSGEYNIPDNASQIMIKITDLLSESLEVIVEA